MLACIQRRQNFSSQREFCPPKVLDGPPVQLSLSVPPVHPCAPKGNPASMASRYPSPAELDAFAQKTGHGPLSIKIFPSNVRVPQHKQLSRTVNGLDTTGHRYSPYSPYPQACPGGGSHGGLLAVVSSTVALKGAVKTPDGRRTKLARCHSTGAPFNNTTTTNNTNNINNINNNNNSSNNNTNPLNSCTAAKHKTYHTGSCQPPDMQPNEALSSGQSHAPQPCLADVRGLLRQMSRAPPSQQGVEPHASPSHCAVAAVAGPGFHQGAPHPRNRSSSSSSNGSGLAFSGVAPPSQSADVVAAQGGYGVWQPHPHPRPTQMGYTCSSGSPDSCLAAQYDRPAPLGFSLGHFFAPPWEGVHDTPDVDCYASLELATASCMGRHAGEPTSCMGRRAVDTSSCMGRPGGDVGLSHPHQHPHHHTQHPQPHIYVPAPPQAYGTDPVLCCGLPSSSLCHASALSSSLLSLECLISEIQPPCIKERMLGRGYQATGLPLQPLEGHQNAHTQLHPVYR